MLASFFVDLSRGIVVQTKLDTKADEGTDKTPESASLAFDVQVPVKENKRLETGERDAEVWLDRHGAFEKVAVFWPVGRHKPFCNCGSKMRDCVIDCTVIQLRERAEGQDEIDGAKVAGVVERRCTGIKVAQDAVKILASKDRAVDIETTKVGVDNHVDKLAVLGQPDVNRWCVGDRTVKRKMVGCATEDRGSPDRNLGPGGRVPRGRVERRGCGQLAGCGVEFESRGYDVGNTEIFSKGFCVAHVVAVGVDALVQHWVGRLEKIGHGRIGHHGRIVHNGRGIDGNWVWARILEGGVGADGGDGLWGDSLSNEDVVKALERKTWDASFEKCLALCQLCLEALGVSSGRECLAMAVLLLARETSSGAGGAAGMLRVALERGELGIAVGVRHLP